MFCQQNFRKVQFFKLKRVWKSLSPLEYNSFLILLQFVQQLNWVILNGVSLDRNEWYPSYKSLHLVYKTTYNNLHISGERNTCGLK